MIDALAECPGIALLAFCVMGNHWHLVLRPAADGQLSNFMLRLTITHARRWLEHRGLGGTGHVYQGRYKSFICEDNQHLLTVLRYVERNPLRANRVARAQDWPWSSLHTPDISSDVAHLPLTAWPITRPTNWIDRVNRPERSAEFEAIRQSATSGKPFGSQDWTQRIAELTGWRDRRPRGRPPRPKGVTAGGPL